MKKEKHLEQLDSEIEQMEALLNNPRTTEDSTSEETPVSTTGDEEIVSQSADTKEESPSEVVDIKTQQAELSETQDESDSDQKVEQKTRTNWKKRYTSLRSHYDAQVYELRSEISQLRDNLLSEKKRSNELVKRMEDLASNNKQAASLYTDEERDILGDETISIITKATEASTKPLKEELEREREARMRAEEEAANRSKKEIQRLFVSRLERLVPFYSEVDTDPGFIKWMEDGDEWSGVKRKTLFQKAVQGGDVGRAAEFYMAYHNVTTKKKPDPLQEEVSPTGTSGESTVPPQKPKEDMISAAYIDKFYDDVVRGKYKGKLALQQEIETKIDKAISEGRVVNS